MTALIDLVRGATFDDFLFNPQYSVVERRDPARIDLTCHFSTGVTLKRPIVSANMDTVTRSEMAIAVAEEGGIGIIDRITHHKSSKAILDHDLFSRGKLRCAGLNDQSRAWRHSGANRSLRPIDEP